jgi:hypothetical protein
MNKMKMSMEHSVGISSLRFCYPPRVLTPSPPTPGTTLAPLTPDICTEIDVDFSVSADGTPVIRGKYVSDNWLRFGLILSAEGGVGDAPCFFDTASPLCKNGDGDSDLGALNEACTPSGPGTGIGGVPGVDGENCLPLGNALIIQEPGTDCPDDVSKTSLFLCVPSMWWTCM